MVQAEIAEDRLNFAASAALTLDGTGDTASMPNSNNFGINGTDIGGCGAATTNPAVPAIGVLSAADVTTVGRRHSQWPQKQLYGQRRIDP